jgi:uncharacterized membrane protein
MYRSSVFFFAGLFAFAIAGFWPTYFVPKFEGDWHVHLHGIAMFSWAVLLVAQAGLIRAGNRELHRRIGKVSYVLVPVIVLSTLMLAHYRLKAGVSRDLLYFLYVQLSLMTIFAAAYGLAIANRRNPAAHARYMICVSLTLIDPILARMLYVHLGIDFPETQYITYGVMDSILIALMGWDLSHGQKVRVYARMLPFFVVLQAPTFFLFSTPEWRSVVDAFAALPLP